MVKKPRGGVPKDPLDRIGLRSSLFIPDYPKEN